MSGRTLRPSFAHMPGPCGLGALPSGKYAISTGSDATLRLHDISDTPTAWWRAEAPEEPELPDLSVTNLHEKAVSCLAVSPTGANFATGSDDGFVRIFAVQTGADRPDADLLQACARFGGPVRGLDFSPTGAFLAAAGEEPGVLKIVMTAQPSSVTVLRAPAAAKGAEAVVVVAFDRSGDFIATVGEHGQAVIWDVEKCKMACALDLGERKARCVAWSPCGLRLILGTNKGIVVVSQGTWLLDHVLEDAGEQDDEDETYFGSSGKCGISALACCSNGSYLLSAKDDSTISLWDVGRKKILSCWKGPEVAQRLFWHPKANAMAMIDTIGQWCIVPDVVPQHMPSPHVGAPALELPTLPETDGPSTRTKDAGDADEEDIKPSKKAKLRRLKQQQRKEISKESKPRKSSKPDSDEDEDEDDNQLENGFTFNASDVDADDEDDSKRDHANGYDDGDSASDEDDSSELAGESRTGRRLVDRDGRRLPRSRATYGNPVPIVATQATFMPTSTPLSEKRSKKRHILAWNLVGAVLSFDESSHDVVEIEFADASKRTIGIKDHYGYTMGCLTSTGVLLASPKKTEHGSLLTFRPFSSWSANSDWTQFFPVDEDVSVIALGHHFAAAVTKPNNIIRVFSLSGIQTSVFGVPGTVVTVAANGGELVVVYSEPHSPALRCEALSISTHGEVDKVWFRGPLALSAGSKLEWIGFTNDTKELCAYDSQGWHWMMADPKSSQRWVPMVQNAAKEGECDWFWVASATSTSLIGTPCLSNERFPPAKPRPSLRSLPLSAPVIEKVTKSGKPTVMERFLRTKLKLNRALAAKAEADELYECDSIEVANAEDIVARMEVETDKCTLALMEEACRNEQNMRAFDLATRLHAKISLKYAIELAKHFNRTALATRVEKAVMRKAELMEENERERTELRKDLAGPRMAIQAGGQHPSEELACSDDDSGTQVMERQKASPAGRKTDQEVKKPSFEIGDVTDDEDERPDNVGKRRDVVPSTAQSVAAVAEASLSEPHEDEGKRAKRPTPMPASQISLKGNGMVETGPAAKKAKRTSANAVGGAARAKKVHNRFLKR